jgi:hypothetical protein
MKYLVVFISFFMLFAQNSFGQNSGSHESQQTKSLSDSMFFDLNQATYSTVNSINYIEIPVWIKSSNIAVNSFDFWFQFDISKLTYVSTTSLIPNLDAFSNFNATSSYLSNTSSGSSINFIVPMLTNLVKLKFSVSGQCTTILPSDFYNINALINGDVSSKKVIENTSTFQVETSYPYCSNKAITFSCSNTIYGKPVQTYLWNFGNNLTSSNSIDSTTYLTNNDYLVSLNLTTLDGCIYNLSDEISVLESPQASFTYEWTPNLSSVILTNTSTINSGTISSSYWEFGDGATSSNFNITHTYTSLGVYLVSLEVVSNLGCSSTYSSQISNVNDLDEYTINELLFYPNPSDNTLHIPLMNAKNIIIYDCLGRKLFSKELSNVDEVIDLNTRDFESGKYFVEVYSHQTISSGSFVVKH